MSARPALELARAEYRALSLYAPNRVPCAVDVSDNTNLWGAPPAALRAIRDAENSALTRYPATYAAALKHALAACAGVCPDEIVTGCGSDDVLDSAIRAFAAPGARVAYPEPSFPMLPLFASMNGLAGVSVPLGAQMDIDPDAMLASGARIIYLCSPNNPTGRALSDDAIARIVERAPGVVILDEAYAEYSGDGWLARGPRYGKLLITRTLSKAFGLAGLRVGYATGDAALVAEVEKSRGPYKVSALAERAAIAALAQDRAWVREHIAHVRSNRERLTCALLALGLAPLPSDANFVLVPVVDAPTVAQRLRRCGVGVRPFPALAGVGDAIRITIGPWAMMQTVLDALAEALACA